MPVHIAIPVPTSNDPEYNQRSLPPYLEALKASGAEAVLVPLNEPPERVAKLLAAVQGVLLPGSKYDVNPQRYGELRAPECAEDDSARTATDELLLQDAFSFAKPILAICHGAQTLNVWRGGSLIQDLKTSVNHRPGREVVEAHSVKIAEDTRLAKLLGSTDSPVIKVNSSHHQAIHVPGDYLRIAAVSPLDGVIEAVELKSPTHFVVAVQWHPERTFSQRSFSRAIFSAFVQAVVAWQPPQHTKKQVK